MMPKDTTIYPKSAIVYIDGLNLYYGIKRMLEKQPLPLAKWLDVQSLAESLLEENEQLKQVKIFTAKVKTGRRFGANREVGVRQANYLNALRAHCPKLEIILGKFASKPVQCMRCEKTFQIPEEKCTDVNIASHILKDAYENNCDVAYLISGDSDLVAPVEMVAKMERAIAVVLPPDGKSDHLISKANRDTLFINREMISQHSLPKQVKNKKNGKIYTCPDVWIEGYADSSSTVPAAPPT